MRRTLFTVSLDNHAWSGVTMNTAIDAAAKNVPVTLAEDPQMYGDLHAILGRAYFRMGRNDRAVGHLQTAIEARRLIAERAIEAGCDDFVAKPVDDAILVETVARHLGRQ